MIKVMTVVSRVERAGYIQKQTNKNKQTKNFTGDVYRAVSTLCLDLGGRYVGVLLYIYSPYYVFVFSVLFVSSTVFHNRVDKITLEDVP